MSWNITLENEEIVLDLTVEQDAAATALLAAARAEEAKQQTGLDRIATGEDAEQTALDRIATGQDRIATGQDRIATGQDRTQTGLDRIATGEDKVQTGLDRIQTGQDRVATGEDAEQTALDRIATGQDRTQTGLDRIATGEDAEQTALDRIATGQDRTQTGLDRTAAATSASQALTSRNQAEGFRDESQEILSDIQALLPNFPRPAVFALNKRAIQDSAIFGQKLKPTNDYLKTIENLNPSLVMVPSAYRAGQLYSVLPEGGAGDFTVSRNGSATFLGANGLLQTAPANVPRLEYNLDGTFRGLLVENAATNLVTRSVEFENPIWTKVSLTASTKVLSPFGTLTANELVSDNTTSIKYVASSLIGGFLANVSRRFSIFIKKSNLRYCLIGVNRSPTIFTAFLIDLDLKTFIRSTGVITALVNNGLLEELPNGFFRFSFDASRNTNGNLTLYFSFTSQPTFGTAGFGLHSFLGTNSSMGFVFGAQVEEGATATSYIPTAATTITRPADIITDQVPAGTTQIRTVVNGVEQIISPPGSSYQLPNGHITRVLML